MTVPLADGRKSGTHPQTLHQELVRGAVVTERLVQAFSPASAASSLPTPTIRRGGQKALEVGGEGWLLDACHTAAIGADLLPAPRCPCLNLKCGSLTSIDKGFACGRVRRGYWGLQRRSCDAQRGEQRAPWARPCRWHRCRTRTGRSAADGAAV